MKPTNPHRITRVIKTNRFVLLLSLLFIVGLGITSCEGPMGPAGPQGEQGPPGPVGPAGSDGSIIHAGEGAPDEETGSSGDFYLDLITGNLFGPKMTEGWGVPTNLQGPEGQQGNEGPQGPQGPEGPKGPQGPAGEDGENGQDGQDGEDGKDGEDGQDGKDGDDGQDGEDGQDGSHIYAGNGAPDNNQGQEGDYYLDKTSYDLYGPKTGSGWGTPVNLQGPPGAANVIYSKWLDIDWNGADTNTYKRMDIIEPFVDEDFINTGSARAYMLHADGAVSPLPYSTPSFRYSFFLRPDNYSDPKSPGTFPTGAGLSFYFVDTSQSLLALPFTKIRYVLIPGGVPAKMQEGFFDDYQAVKKYYGIPD